MKTLKHIAFKILLLSVFIIFSCQQEDSITVDSGPDGQLVANSVLVDLMTRTTLNDGSVDNILDNANCFSVQLPVTVFVGGLEILVNSQNDFQTIEDIFDDTAATLEFEYPITILLSDFTQVAISNATELAAQASNCNGENEGDSDIECIDFQYSLSYSTFNTLTEELTTVTVANDIEHHAFLTNIDVNDVITINFPFTLIFQNGTTTIINSVENLEDALEAAINACDEDDDYDFNDDDCGDCDIDELLNTFNGCAYFAADKLERNDQDLENTYTDFRFQFINDGTMRVTDGTVFYAGSWSSTGEGQNTAVTINVPDYPVFNDVWSLNEISTSGDEVKVDLRKGDDRLRFECDSDYIAPEDPNLIGDFIDECSIHFEVIADGGATNTSGGTLDFQEGGVLVLLSGGGYETFVGTWELTSINGEDAIITDIPGIDPFFEFINNIWIYDGVSGPYLNLESEDEMNTLSIKCIDLQERFDYVTSNEWVAVEYFVAGFNVLDLIDSYTFTFETDYTIQANSATDPYQEGDWSGSDLYTVMNFQFPSDPLANINGDWFILDYRPDLNRIFMGRIVSGAQEFLTLNSPTFRESVLKTVPIKK